LIGGAGNLFGAIIGGVLFMTMKDTLSTHIPQWEWILGLILLVIVFWLRGGVTGLIKSLRDFFRERMSGGPPVEEVKKR
ncbi:MAG: hypothetical protein MUO68_08835, partial [Desulfobacteraceae bacterium]|nr:hypothetical protein [Desulfobacteraceae bacterium]